MSQSGEYQSGQMGQTVNLLVYTFGGSNPSSPTTSQPNPTLERHRTPPLAMPLTFYSNCSPIMEDRQKADGKGGCKESIKWGSAKVLMQGWGRSV